MSTRKPGVGSGGLGTSKGLSEDTLRQIEHRLIEEGLLEITAPIDPQPFRRATVTPQGHITATTISRRLGHG